MATKTAPIEPEVELSAAELDAEYQRLSYAMSQGDGVAAAKVQRIEERIQSVQRAERRRQAAAAEAARLAAAAEVQAQAGIRQAELAAHAANLRCKQAALDQVEQITEELIVAVRAALIAGDEARSSALRLGFSPGLLTSSQIASYLHWKLGRDGADTAGLSEMAPTFPSLRVPLVQPTHKES